MKKLLFSSFLSLLAACVMFSCKKEVEPDTLKIFSLTEKVGNYGYKELEEASIKWFFGFPTDPTNPLLDETGAHSIAAKQPVSGFTILPSNFGGKTTRTLTIPASNYVYLTPLASLVWYYENDACDPDWKPAAGQSLKDFLVQELAKFSDTSKGLVSIKLDGTELVTDKNLLRVKSDVMEVIIHKDFNNPQCDYTGKKAKVVSEGYGMLLKITKGKHILVMKGTIPADKPEDIFEAEVTWNLTVE
jgi:hypothetical protein